MSATTKDLVYLCRALKAPSLLAAAERLLEQAGRGRVPAPVAQISTSTSSPLRRTL